MEVDLCACKSMITSWTNKNYCCRMLSYRDGQSMQNSVGLHLFLFLQLYNKGRLCELGRDFSDLDVFSHVLNVNDKRFPYKI